MAVCDVCNAPGMGTMISSEDMRKAVFGKGFNPFALGLAINPMAQLFGAEAVYENWKNTIVAQDTSDWNICAKCMAALRPYLSGTPRPTGVKEATVSSNPLVSAMAGVAAEKKYQSPDTPPSPAPAPSTPARTTTKPQPKSEKKWWEFWK